MNHDEFVAFHTQSLNAFSVRVGYNRLTAAEIEGLWQQELRRRQQDIERREYDDAARARAVEAVRQWLAAAGQPVLENVDELVAVAQWSPRSW
jgi:hypothetical protein